eukprot:363256-Chlamydomonas_euryale.AAC.10
MRTRQREPNGCPGRLPGWHSGWSEACLECTRCGLQGPECVIILGSTRRTQTLFQHTHGAVIVKANGHSGDTLLPSETNDQASPKWRWRLPQY